MIQKVYGESAVHHATVLRWYNTFSEGQESISNEQRCRRLMTRRTRKNITRVANILKEDCRSSCRLIAEWMVAGTWDKVTLAPVRDCVSARR